MRRGKILAALVALQLGLALLWRGVESARAPEAPLAWESLDAPAPALVVVRQGLPHPVPPETHLVHFWATWCGPCLTELPELLEACEDEGVPLLAVTSEPWPDIASWFGGQVPGAIVRDPDGRTVTDWQVSGLPDTFLVEDGRLIARMGGPRDWSSPTARRFLGEVAAGHAGRL